MAIGSIRMRTNGSTWRHASRDYRKFDSAERSADALWLKTHYQLIGHPTKPKLDGCDFGIWREDYEAVNGFDESFVGWGCEDDDLGVRLRRAGTRIDTILRYTRVYHLWHALDPTYPGVWKRGANVNRLLSERRPIRCSRGLVPLGERADCHEPDARSKVVQFRMPRPAVKIPSLQHATHSTH
jgi:GT2 family glycosyltransferase